jgi:hypothetical protein
MTLTRKLLAGVLVLGIVGAACGDDSSSRSSSSKRSTGTTATTAAAEPVIDPGDGGKYAPVLDPANFVDGVDNPYLPLPPGATWAYEGLSDGESERVDIVVTPDRKEILGISAVVVRDTVKVDGQVVEDTYDWFAQDREGNVWYLGEDVKDFENGKLVSTGGSWEAGVDGAVPGIVMPAKPEVGHAFRQEFYVGEAEDMAEIIEVDATVTVPFGRFDRVVVTEDWNPLDPDVIEQKSYAPGIGLVAEATVAGGRGRAELVEFAAGT